MATRTISAVGGNWSALTAWVEGSAPTAADDVVATALSASLTIDGTSGSPSLCRSADFTGFTATLTQASGATLNVGDAAGGNLKFVSGMTYSPNTAAVINLVSTTSGNTITTAGKTLPQLVFNGSGGAWSLADALTCRSIITTVGTVTATSTINTGATMAINGGTLNAGGTITLTSSLTVAGGTLASANNTVSCTNSTFSSGTANIKTLTQTGSHTTSGATVTIGTGGISCTSMAVSSGSLTTGGNITLTSTLNVSATGSLDATGFGISGGTSMSMSSSGTFKVATYSGSTTLSITAGTSTITGNVSGTTFSSTGNTARTINMGSGTWTLSGTGNVVSISGSNLTLNQQTSTIAATDTSVTTKTFAGGSHTFNNLTVSGAASAATFTISGSNTFNTLTFNPDSNILLTAGTTQTVSALSITGTSGHTIALASTSSGVAATISKASGTVSGDYIVMKDQTANGGATFYAGANSTNTSGNTGWIFTAPGSGDIKVELLGTFTAKPVKAYVGGSFVKKPIKFWNGSSWVTPTY